MRILVVDDNRTNAKLLLSYLKGFGECHEAHNGQEALEAIKKGMEAGNPYELVCLDIIMPIIDGHETLKTIREFEKTTFNITGKTTKIIMTTALEDIETVMNSYKELCDGYLTKPIRKEDFFKELVTLGLLERE